jgi:energy-coupling factor transporter ATP-binding protein EcfA2
MTSLKESGMSSPETIKLGAKNFQAWEQFDLDIQGLTVLIGPSDTGKSSMFRALLGVARNELTSGQVYTAGDELTVTLQVEGNTVSASRTKKGSTQYVINGGKFDKLNRTLPKEVGDLKFGTIKIGDVTIDPIFSGQHDSKFMLQGVGPQAMNTILGAFSSTEKLEHGKREANVRIAGKNSEARILAKEIQEAETRKFSLEELEQKLAPIQAELNRLEYENQQLVGLRNQLIEVIESHEFIHQIKKITEALVLPEVDELYDLQITVQTIRGLRVSQIRATQQARLLESITAVHATWDMVKALYHEQNAHQELSFFLSQGTGKAQTCIDKLAPVLANVEQGVQVVTRQTQTVQQILVTLATHARRFDPAEFDRYEMAVLTLDAEEAALKQKLLDEEEERRRLAGNWVRCPQCSEKFNADIHQCEA